MVCTCVNELKRLQSGGCCTTLMTDSFPYATGVFNLVCALRAAAAILEAESDQGLPGWLANDLETLLPSPRPAFPTQGTPESRNLAGKPSLKPSVFHPFSRAEDRR